MTTHTLHLDLYTPAHDDRPVFVTGNFCGWATDTDTLQLHPAGDGRYNIGLPVDEGWPETIEYKYYRAGEGGLELNEQGELTDNRRIARSTTAVQDEVPYWQWDGSSINSAFLPIEQTLYVEYPGCDRPRRVQIALPYDYETSGEAYPVLYINDGQNLLGEGEGYGSWLTECRLAQLATRKHHGVIVVAIDHAGEGRLREYTVEKVKPTLGEGRTYLDFVVNTLKPAIDANFRTLSDAAHTGMGGSSLGGLITIWAGLLYPDVFGRWLVFSPALWISPGVYRAAAQRKLERYTKVYLYGGESESTYMVPSLTRFQRNLRCVAEACSYLQTSIDPDGLHEEKRWSIELPKAISWLFFTNSPVHQIHEELATATY
ncbi:alpha/beta hydrolase [Fibrella forsythiae]|uniref:Alpha/beta hydrolase n=1 Tax=Fibrella forsythiae TaxID=2817061 RepID=A0ABS3JBV9_9BACT|nr:alpha/beta hydrolase-fold protein [Fibrella forsythiae]MBO0947467.1 alpha/beta hydrolase [Fibrella forsythiae]